MPNNDYQEIYVQWISKRGKRVLIWAAGSSFFLYFITLAIAIPIVITFNIDLKSINNRILFTTLSTLITVNCFFGIFMTYIIGGKVFNQKIKYLIGIWYCLFGFIVLGVLILKEPIIERKVIRSNNNDIVPGYRNHFVFKRVERTIKIINLREFQSNDYTYWIPRKTKNLMWVSLVISVILLIAIIFSSIFFFLKREDDSVYLIIGYFLITYISIFNIFNIVFLFVSLYRRWMSKRKKIGLSILSLLCGNVIVFVLLLIYQLGYNTDDYDEINIDDAEKYGYQIKFPIQ